MAKPIAGQKCTKEWGKHLRKWGKRDANGRLRGKLKVNPRECKVELRQNDSHI